MNEKRVPLQHDRNSTPGVVSEINEILAKEAYKEYSDQGHGDQSFERLHERGGFGCIEISALLYCRIKRLEGNPILWTAM